MDKFERHDLVRHVKTGHSYMVLAAPRDGVRIEATNEPAYVYQDFWRTDGGLNGGGLTWVRPAKEMEDGRFELELHTTHGAEGRLYG